MDQERVEAHTTKLLSKEILVQQKEEASEGCLLRGSRGLGWIIRLESNQDFTVPMDDPLSISIEATIMVRAPHMLTRGLTVFVGQVCPLVIGQEGDDD